MGYEDSTKKPAGEGGSVRECGSIFEKVTLGYV